MLPSFLPPGIHPATWDEFAERFVVFARSNRRLRIGDQLRSFIEESRNSKIVSRIYVAGSYVTEKVEPNDVDCLIILDPAIIGAKLPPFQYNLLSRRMVRRLFGGDVLAAIEGSKAEVKYLEFSQTSRNGDPVGIVEIQP